ncbi:GIY-YIG nuclease family protein [Caldimonas manganoxidans]|uniref:GIY-YIG nuclease family protein n=1 Tax=Caldimonas manganoxidans TaxID=196015 RepID=UPI0003782D46|nr:GIY-YIG nuclease family protein [Caldimonas manganoxidans]
MTEKRAFSVRIFVPMGDPEGLRIIEKSNWTGQGLMFPRAIFAEVRQRPELQRAGVYVLWGPGVFGQLPRIYVGEGDFLRARLDQHHKQKDFWTHAIVFTSKDQNLNKAHVQYLEARLVSLASQARRAELDNGNVPQLGSSSFRVEPNSHNDSWSLSPVGMCAGRWPACAHVHEACLIRRMSPWALP